MKLINPSYEILEQSPGLKGIYKAIEVAGRTCYKSLDKITEDSAEGFVNRMINSKHFSMLEHGAVYLKIPIYYPDEWDQNNKGIFNKVANSPYSKIIRDSSNNFWYLSTNLRVIKENNAEFLLEYWCEPTEFHEKRVTVRFTTSNGIMREFTRHRSHSFAVESTRYCNYSKDKFNNELTFIIPSWIEMEEGRITTDSFGCPTIVNEETYDFLSGLGASERSYFRLINGGWKPQQAREVLPLATKCDMIMTGFVSDWQHFFRLRTSIIAETGKPHPDASALADPLYKEFINRNYLKEM